MNGKKKKKLCDFVFLLADVLGTGLGLLLCDVSSCFCNFFFQLIAQKLKVKSMEARLELEVGALCHHVIFSA